MKRVIAILTETPTKKIRNYEVVRSDEDLHDTFRLKPGEAKNLIKKEFSEQTI